jgi:hypothetical protein
MAPASRILPRPRPAVWLRGGRVTARGAGAPGRLRHGRGPAPPTPPNRRAERRTTCHCRLGACRGGQARSASGARSESGCAGADRSRSVSIRSINADRDSGERDGDGLGQDVGRFLFFVEPESDQAVKPSGRHGWPAALGARGEVRRRGHAEAKPAGSAARGAHALLVAVATANASLPLSRKMSPGKREGHRARGARYPPYHIPSTPLGIMAQAFRRAQTPTTPAATFGNAALALAEWCVRFRSGVR